jgi:hypothetical protein
VAIHQFQGLIVFGIAWLITSGSLLELHALDPRASSIADLAMLTFANLVATVIRFVLLRVWVFRRQRRAATATDLSEAPVARHGVVLPGTPLT